MSDSRASERSWVQKIDESDSETLDDASLLAVTWRISIPGQVDGLPVLLRLVTLAGRSGE
jgi:hypothetical protein